MPEILLVNVQFARGMWKHWNVVAFFSGRNDELLNTESRILPWQINRRMNIWRCYFIKWNVQFLSHFLISLFEFSTEVSLQFTSTLRHISGKNIHDVSKISIFYSKYSTHFYAYHALFFLVTAVLSCEAVRTKASLIACDKGADCQDTTIRTLRMCALHT